MRKKLTYIVSDIGKALAFEWIADGIDKLKYDLEFILVNPKNNVLEQFLKKQNIPVLSIPCRSKKAWPGVWWQLYRHFKVAMPNIIHCHLQQATILGLSAGKMAGVPRRIHTRHHSTMHHYYYPKGVYWDKLINTMSTQIVAISNQVKRILIEWEKVPEAKIVLIPHGFRLEQFETPDNRIVTQLRQKYDLEDASPVIGVISRFIELKGVQYIIPAFQEILKSFPDAVLLLFNAEGDYSKPIYDLLASLPDKNYRTILFEPDIAAAYHLMDICIHVPIADHLEAFGQIYIESLAAGIPLVCTLSGIANDIMVHMENSWVVGYKDARGITVGIHSILSNHELRANLIKGGKETAKAFSLQRMIANLENMYDAD